MALAGLRVMNPVTTGVQIQRRIDALFHRTPYRIRYTFVPLARISPEMQHAVISAEDGSFYQHHGIDWAELQKVAQESGEKGELIRGASTLTQQLVKNLFFTTHRNPLRKLCEYTLAPMADRILGKRRVLELYLNVVEWGQGVFGCEAAARTYFEKSCAELTSDEAVAMSVVLPNPRRFRANAPSDYIRGRQAWILNQMRLMGGNQVMRDLGS